VFAALSQLEIAPWIVNGLFYAILAIVVGSSIVAIGGGGIQTMSRYWDRAASRAEEESGNLQSASEGASDRIQERAEERRDQLRPDESNEQDEVRIPQDSNPEPATGRVTTEEFDSTRRS
jgi:hypothetical protein